MTKTLNISKDQRVMSSEEFEVVRQHLGISPKIVKRYAAMRGGPLTCAEDFIEWHERVVIAGRKQYAKDYMNRPGAKERVKRLSRESYIRNRETVLKRTKERQSTLDGRIKKRESVKKWILANPEWKREYLEKQKASGASIEYQRKWRALNPEKSRAKTKAWRDRQHEKLGSAFHEAQRIANLKWKKDNPEKARARKRAEHHRGMKDPVFVVVKRLRTRLNDEIRFRARKTKKFCSVIDLLGCSREELARHIESQFTPGMTWENRKLWHIDHIIPVSSFDMMNLEEQKKCFHFTNLRPLWASENYRKGNKITHQAS